MAVQRPKVTVSIPRQAYRGIALLANHTDQLPVIRKCASETTASIGKLVKVAAGRTSLTEDDVSNILDALLAMHGVRRRLNVSADELVHALDTCIEQQATEEWKKENLAAWQAAREVLKEAFRSDDPIGVLEKSIRLAAAHQYESPTPVDAELEVKFNSLVAQWKPAVEAMSSVTAMVLHPAYQQIIALGPRAILLLLRELDRELDHWFWALRVLTGEDPVPPSVRGNMGAMREAWLAWGRSKGYRW